MFANHISYHNLSAYLIQNKNLIKYGVKMKSVGIV